MEKLGFGLDDDSATGDQKQTNPQEPRLLRIQRYNKYLVHTSKCRDANCRRPYCQIMKRVVQHDKSCKKDYRECPICKQLTAINYYHSKHCRVAKCRVPFCVTIKNNIRQQKLRIAQMIKRCVGAVKNRRRSGAVLQPSPGNSNSSSQPSPGAQPHKSPHPPQPGIGMKPSSRPPVAALQTNRQVQAAAARQTVPHMVAANYGKGNPDDSSMGNPVVNPPTANTGLVAPNPQMQAQMQKPMSQMMSGVPNCMLNMRNVTQWENPGYAQNHQPHQNTQSLPNPQLGMRQPSQIMGAPNSTPITIGNSTMGPPQVMPNPGPSIAGMQRPTQAWQQLLQTLKSPVSAQQQQQVLAILKANPQLMSAFIRETVAQQQQQQQTLFNEGNMNGPGPSVAGMQRPTQAWQQLLQTLRYPSSAQQQRQVLAILKANPQVMSAFIKERRAELQQQQQQLQQQQQQQQQQMLLNEGIASLSQDFKDVLLNGEDHNITFNVKDKTFRAHRDILRARCEVFRSMLTYDMMEKRCGVVDVPDCDPQAFQQLLFYIYTGKVEAIDENNMFGLYYAADKYLMQHLKQQCCEFIKKSLSVTNVCEAVKFAIQHSDDELLKCATNYFISNAKAIFPTVEWQHFFKEHSTIANELIIKSLKRVNVSILHITRNPK